MQLPRGTGNDDEAPRATARWAFPHEIAEYAFRSGDLWLGEQPWPSEEANILVERLRLKQAEISLDTARDGSVRRAEIDTLEEEIEELVGTSAIEIGIRDDRHHLVLAGSRAGKTRTLLTPNLKRYPGSIIVTDPKGELAATTAHIRSALPEDGGPGQRVIVLDPYNTSRLPAELHGTWNPLDLVSKDNDLAIDVAASIADALIVRTNPENEHFDDSARTFLKGLILFVADTHDGRATRNLIQVYEYLMRGACLELARDHSGAEEKPTAFSHLLALMQGSETFDGVMAAAAETILSMGDRERGSVLSTARRSLEFLERRPMRRLFAASSFAIDDLKTDPQGVTLYLCLPPQRMPDCGRFLRLAIAMMLERIYEIEGQPATGHPILAMLEEFPVLGHMKLLEQAAGYAAGFGLKLMIVCQDLTQLSGNYPRTWESFVGNAGCIQAFANADQTSLEYLSKRLGECEVLQTQRSLSSATALSSSDPGAHAQIQALMAQRGDASLFANPLSLLADPATVGESTTTTENWNTQRNRTPLLLPDEIQRLFAREQDSQIVLINGQMPMWLNR